MPAMTEKFSLSKAQAIHAVRKGQVRRCPRCGRLREKWKTNPQACIDHISSCHAPREAWHPSKLHKPGKKRGKSVWAVAQAGAPGLGTRR